MQVQIGKTILEKKREKTKQNMFQLKTLGPKGDKCICTKTQPERREKNTYCKGIDIEYLKIL